MIDPAKLLLEFRPLLAEDRLNALGPGSRHVVVFDQLQQLESLIAPQVKDRDFASACLAGLWLYHDFLDESHTISQDLDTLEGSYWHALMHRREPDYWNSKYWFKRCPRHPIFGELCQQAAAIAEQAGTPSGGELLVRQHTWDPPAFVDLCESASRGPDALDRLCRQAQRSEWELLFLFCQERAFGPA
jgi:hypothetical protein